MPLLSTVFHSFAVQIMMKRYLSIFLIFCLATGVMAQTDSIDVQTDSLYADSIETCNAVCEDATLPTYVLKDPREGLRFSLDMGVMASFGSHRYSGTGFYQRLSATYDTPLSDRISLSVGGFFQNTTWSGSSHQSAGIEARLNYMFNERLFGEIYYSKTVTPHYDIDRIGASLEYHFGSSFSMGISVEGSRVSGNGNARRQPYYLNYW